MVHGLVKFVHKLKIKSILSKYLSYFLFGDSSYSLHFFNDINSHVQIHQISKI